MGSTMQETTKKRTTARPRRAAKTAARTAPTHDEIALRARALYEQSGFAAGRDEEFWLEAERQLIAEKQA